MDLLFNHVDAVIKGKSVSAIVGLDARGFLFGPSLALHLGVPFIPVRKSGKLPGEVSGMKFELEYGSDEFQIQKDSLKSGDSAIIVDDLLATGGSLSATCKLLEGLGVNVVECLVIMELKELKGRERLTSPVYSLLQY
ncbi:hypothetical protein AAG570_001221 [Ranatra chinensis]|uniref:adenine phosphoribosyltransferase n=1 Tax=Ranatra chinensis TaxID=642074 RepID=A0ABD0YQ27_9HEMI